MKRIKYLGENPDGDYEFIFRCEGDGCDEKGKMTVPKKHATNARFECPQCGSVYVCYGTPPKWMCVVKCIFALKEVSP